MTCKDLVIGGTAKKMDKILEAVRERRNGGMLSDLRLSATHFQGTVESIVKRRISSFSRDVLESEITERNLGRVRKELEEKVKEATQELEIKRRMIEEMNAAVKVLLEVREKDRKELEQTLLFNVMQLLEPCLDKLKNSCLNETQRGYLETLESSLHQFVSPLLRELVASGTNLTPTEARIANLIKIGKSSKEIAEDLNLSIRTIETNRRNIRKKLGLNKSKTNLHSHLQPHVTSQEGWPLFRLDDALGSFHKGAGIQAASEVGCPEE